MSILEFVPIGILICISVFSIAIAIILKIHNNKSIISKNDNDFIDDIIEKKKRSLNSNIGGISWKSYVLSLILFPLSLTVISYLFLPYKPICILFAIIGLFVPDIFIKITQKQSKKAFNEKYAMALRALAASLRSGLTIEQAVLDIAKNPFIDKSIQEGFRQIASDIKVGIPIDKAFKTFADTSGSNDASDVASAISMQIQVGGSEAKVIASIAQNINDRLMTNKEIKLAFADTSILLYTMDILPWGIILLLSTTSSQFIEPYFSSLPMFLVFAIIVVVLLLGSIITHKLVNSTKGGN